jgi:predicted ATPase
MERIYIENLGPIKKINLKLRQVIVLIGLQSSGKSTVAKLITIFRDFNFIAQHKSFEDCLIDYNIQSFFRENTKIEYKSKKYIFLYHNGKYEVTYKSEDFSHLMQEREMLAPNVDKASKEFDEKVKMVESLSQKLNETDKRKQKADYDNITNQISDIQKDITTYLNHLVKTYNNLTKIVNFSKYSIYIPSERNLFSILSKSIFSFLNENISIPKVLSNFGALIEKALTKKQELDIKFLDIKYVHEGGEHVVTDLKTRQRFLLSESSSGYQTIIPLILAIEGFSDLNTSTLTFVVEEPELNLFPKSQYELIKFLISKCHAEINNEKILNDLIVTTHSPYCLSAFNNCLLAGIEGKSQSDLVKKIIPQKYWIDPDNFIAYEFYNGKAKNIVDKTSKLIDENYLDEASEIINADFNLIFELYKRSK